MEEFFPEETNHDAMESVSHSAKFQYNAPGSDWADRILPDLSKKVQLTARFAVISLLLGT